MCDRNMVYRECTKSTITLQCYQQYTQDIEQHPQPQHSFTPTLKRARQLHCGFTTCAIQSHCFHNQQRSSERAREQIRNICRRQTHMTSTTTNESTKTVYEPLRKPRNRRFSMGFKRTHSLQTEISNIQSNCNIVPAGGDRNAQQNANVQRF